MDTKTKTVKIRVARVGQSFGCCGQVVARNGRVLAEGPTRPRGGEVQAEEDARELAAKKGWRII